MDERAFAAARERMVREHLQARDIFDLRVLEVMRRVPRHRFVPPEAAAEAYEDRPLPIGQEQTISQPLMVALMAQMLKLTGCERVLDVGTGSGYGAAVLAELTREVITVERHAALGEQARVRLAELGYTNVTVRIGDGSEGYAAAAPYDRIHVAAASPRVPEALIAQLAPEGRLIIPVGEPGLQTLTVITKDSAGRAFTHEHGGCAFVPLIGAQGWPNDPGQQSNSEF
ncbi:MAG TPA: protein-L-isoaspartate(D-aspartate) O-methyltransferase [Chthonomonadaceae bacterium]|nr:protein-L-isoaspartate(D-aspartate) O-methyltransferase [Chthonomonadaceae bacterium]